MLRNVLNINKNLQNLIDIIHCERIISEDDRCKIYQLRYRSYLRKGLISANTEKKFHDNSEEDINSILIGMYLDDNLVGSIRLHIYTEKFRNAPTVNLFKDIFLDSRRQFMRIVDPNRFVIDPDISQTEPRIIYIGLRVAYLASLHFRADITVAGVRRGHHRLYKELFSMDLLTEDSRVYPGLNKSYNLMGVESAHAQHRISERYRYMSPAKNEIEALFGPEKFL